MRSGRQADRGQVTLGLVCHGSSWDFIPPIVGSLWVALSLAPRSPKDQTLLYTHAFSFLDLESSPGTPIVFLANRIC